MGDYTASPNKSPSVQIRSVSFARMAGVQRIDECTRQKLSWNTCNVRTACRLSRGYE
jgi:hypothetical protein